MDIFNKIDQMNEVSESIQQKNEPEFFLSNGYIYKTQTKPIELSEKFPEIKCSSECSSKIKRNTRKVYKTIEKLFKHKNLRPDDEVKKIIKSISKLKNTDVNFWAYLDYNEFTTLTHRACLSKDVADCLYELGFCFGFKIRDVAGKSVILNIIPYTSFEPCYGDHDYSDLLYKVNSVDELKLLLSYGVKPFSEQSMNFINLVNCGQFEKMEFLFENGLIGITKSQADNLNKFYKIENCPNLNKLINMTNDMLERLPQKGKIIADGELNQTTVDKAEKEVEEVFNKVLEDSGITL